MGVLVGNSLALGSGKARHKLSGTCWGPPDPAPSPLSPLEIGVMLSTVTWVRTGLGTSEPETDGLWAYQSSTVPSLLAQPIKMSSFAQQAPGLLKAPGQGMGVVLIWQGPCPPCPLVLLHRFPEPAPRGQCDRQCLTASWLTGPSGPVGSPGAGSAPPHPLWLPVASSQLDTPLPEFGLPHHS